MTAIQPSGRFATPWGVEVDTFPAFPDQEPDSFNLNAEGMLIAFGIYDSAARRRFLDDMGAGTHKPLEQYGAKRPPRLKIEPPPAAVYPRVLAEHEAGLTSDDRYTMRDVIDQWATELADHVRWYDRAPIFLAVLRHQLKEMRGMPAEMSGLALCSMITCVLESLGEHEIDCIEQAAFYALAEHDAWRKAGIDWLEPVKATWFAEWRRARPSYCNVARSVSRVRDLPPWLAARSV
jgi:hypothetical protein